ncbi:glycoside hydrolase family 47 protein [Rhizoctonia solani AG-1 IA]|uniref:alpha-1,2-Mannosidase n=1 Tax=Thanatephorus cucumeris (strain AG1-IA) TaxID=983506 RepID=L8WYY9_THACA|nr:glycoside hydrolase family 47 protein [Rhizoctonia solani AG-1 IA]
MVAYLWNTVGIGPFVIYSLIPVVTYPCHAHILAHVPSALRLATTTDMAGLRKENNKAPKSQEGLNKNTSPEKPTSTGSFYWAIVAGLLGCALANRQFSGLIPLSRSPTPPASPVSRINVKLEVDIEKRDAIVAAFRRLSLLLPLRFSYSHSERDAFGADEYHPISQKGSNLTDAGGIGYTIADSLDTIIMMQQQGYDFDAEYERAKTWIRDTLSFDRDANFNTFEDGKCTSKGVLDKDNGNMISVAEAATLQLEFKYLSYLTEEDSYWRAVEKVRHASHFCTLLTKTRVVSRLWESSKRQQPSRSSPYFSPPKQGNLLYRTFDLARAEIHTMNDQMYDDAMAAIREHLLMRTPTSKIVHTGELQPTRAGGYQQRLAFSRPSGGFRGLICFLGGSLLLGVTDGGRMRVPPDASKFNEREKNDWTMGVKLIEGCMATHETDLRPKLPISEQNTTLQWYETKPHLIGISKGPRTSKTIHHTTRDIFLVESLFLAYRLTGDPKYRHWGWNIFQSIEKHCKVSTGGYATVLNVDKLPVSWDDKQETFLLSETLKYLFLLFSDNTVLPLDEIVFNTEAHPFPVFTPSLKTGFA